MVVEPIGGAAHELAQLRGGRGTGPREQIDELLPNRGGKDLELSTVRDGVASVWSHGLYGTTANSEKQAIISIATPASGALPSTLPEVHTSGPRQSAPGPSGETIELRAAWSAKMKPVFALVSLALAVALSSPHSSMAATQPSKGAPAGSRDRMASAPPLIKLVYAGKGQVHSSVRKTVRDSTDILLVNWPYVLWGGHSTTLYSLGKSSLDPARLMYLIEQSPDAVLVNMDLEPGDDAPKAELGVRYPMHELGEQLALVVMDVSPCTFTLIDASHHHTGSVSYGAFKDSSGELWLFEECTGDYFTSPKKFLGLHHRQMVAPTHKMLQALLNMYGGSGASGGQGQGTSGGQGQETSGSEGPCPAQFRSSHTVGVNGPITTEVEVKPGDQVSIRASGLVTFGIFAGQGGPEGIQFNPSYSYFPDSPHGCLMGRIRTSGGGDADRWFLIGKGTDLTAKESGILQLNVNDNDPGNNTGEFSVDITVCKAH